MTNHDRLTSIPPEIVNRRRTAYRMPERKRTKIETVVRKNVA